MDYRQTPVGKRTRLQENLFFKKYCEEKKKAKSGVGSHEKEKNGVKDADVVTEDENVDSDQQNNVSQEFNEGENSRNSRNRGARKSVKRSRKGMEMEDHSEDSGEKVQKAMEMKKRKNVGLVGCNLKQKRGFKNEIKGGNGVVHDDDDGDIVFLGEEVVSNGNSSRVPSSLGSGLNSGCARGKKVEHVDADEVISSRSKRDKPPGIIDGVSSRGQLEAASSEMGKSTHSDTVYVLSSEESTESGNSDESLYSVESLDSSDSEESESKLSHEVDTDASNDGDFAVDESLRSQSDDDLSCSHHNNCEEKEERNNDDRLEKFVKDSIICIEEEEDREEEEEQENVGFSCMDNAKDGGNNEDVEPRKINRKEEEIEGGLRRRKVLGLDVLINCNGNNNTESKSIAERIRPRILSESKRKKLKLGTYSCPLPVPDDDKSESLSDSSRPDDEKSRSFSESEGSIDEEESKDKKCKKEVKKHNKRSRLESNCVDFIKIFDEDGNKDKKCKRQVKEQRKRRCLTSQCADFIKILDEDENKDKKCKREVKKQKKRKHLASNCVDFIKILANSILEKEDLLKANTSNFEEVREQKTLRIKFKFEDETPALPEQETWKKEIGALFDEMEFSLKAGEISSSDPCKEVDNDDMISSDSETIPAVCCRSGKHDLILDEAIGLRCRYCPFVQLEMKYIFPPLAKDPFKRWENKDHSKSECSLVDKLQFRNSSLKDQLCISNAEGTVWDIIPGVRERMYPHQCEGFEFIWKNLAGGICIKNLKSPLVDEGNGCIISHAPGTGKTCLAITFLLSFMKLYPTCRPVIIAPCSMLLTWEEEFQKWNVDIPFHNVNKLELSGKEQEKMASILGQPRKVRHNYVRMLKLYLWTEGRSVLGISYRLFEKLAGKHVKKGDNDQIRKILLELPGILVLDEGHTPRNDQSLIWKALSEVKTKRRIILSGTPFQNNFTELYNTLCLVNRNFVHQIPAKCCRGYGRRSAQKSNIDREKWEFLTSIISKNADDGIKELRHMIDPFVHVYKGTILQDKLPGKRATRLDLRPTPLQENLLNHLEHKSGVKGFRRTHLVSLISVHPSLVAEVPEFSNYGSDLKRNESDPNAGVKTKFVIELVRLSESLHEKVLVFSEYIEPLTFIMNQLKSNFEWREGREVLYMDGTRPGKQRQTSISSLNNPTSEVRVLLASTRACSEGINLVGASRVILLDVVWNPSIEKQAIHRAYRLGQQKFVHVYHLVTAGTVEVEKFDCKTQKDRLSKLVFSSRDSNACQIVNPPTDLEDKILELMVQHKTLKNIFEQIIQLLDLD